MGEIVRNPEFELASKQLEEAKEKLLSLLLEIGELEQHICKNIEAEYMLKVGCYEYKAFEHQTALLRLKRKIELVQKKLNHNETPELESIEEQLDCEYRNYEEQLKEQLEALNDSLERRRGRILGEGETVELKALYRSLVKRLHPDLHPNISCQYLQMFRNAVDAYACGDITVLRALDVASRGLPLEATCGKNSMQMLEEQLASTAFQIGLAEVRIGDIKGEYPYAEWEFLEDDERVAVRVYELLEIISGFEEEYSVYARKLGDLLGDNDE